jgi:hypothetical protein
LLTVLVQLALRWMTGLPSIRGQAATQRAAKAVAALRNLRVVRPRVATQLAAARCAPQPCARRKPPTCLLSKTAVTAQQRFRRPQAPPEGCDTARRRQLLRPLTRWKRQSATVASSILMAGLPVSVAARAWCAAITCLKWQLGYRA